MKPKEQESRAQAPPRIVRLHALFVPERSDQADRVKDFAAFIEFHGAAMARVAVAKRKARAGRTADLKKHRALLAKVGPIIREVLTDRVTTAEAARKIKRLGPDVVALRGLFEVWGKAVAAPPEAAAAEREKLAQAAAELARVKPLQQALEAVGKGLLVLAAAVGRGDAEGAKYLAEAAIQAATLLRVAEGQQPTVFREIARQHAHWPVLADAEKGWAERERERVAALDLGADLAPLRARFRQPRGHDGNLPARLWAKAAVRTIEETRLRFLLFRAIVRDFGSEEGVADFCMAAGWKIGEFPAWAKNSGELGQLSQASVPKWKGVIREMIRDQVPDLHLHTDWENQRNTAKAAGRGTPGAIRTRILDDICDALERLAPEFPRLDTGTHRPNSGK